MKNFWNWIIRNVSNIFTLIGIFLTLFFSIFYVPGYIKENELEKNRNLNSELVENIQEIVYNQYSFNQSQIEDLIKGKEIKYKLKYSFTVDELLIQTQEAFLSNKFIPLNERIIVVNKIDSIRSTLKPTSINLPKETKSNNIATIISFIIGVLGAIISSLGLYSFSKKLSKDKKDDVNKLVEEETEFIEERVIKAVQFEKQIEEILQKNNLDYKSNNSSKLDADFIVRINEKNRVAISVKYLGYKSPGTKDIERFLAPFSEIDYPGILIMNKADNRIMFYLNKINEKFISRKTHIIISSDKDSIENELMKIIKSYR